MCTMCLTSLLQMDKQKADFFKVQETDGMTAVRRVCYLLAGYSPIMYYVASLTSKPT